jgi:hypothetical protein
MAEYGYSTPYRGQTQPTLPPGYMEAATAPGRYLAQGISSIGANIGQALERYGQAKAESQYLEQRLESLSPYLQATLGNVQQGSPESKLVSSLEKYSGMSNAKKKALLADAEFFLQRKDQEAKNQIAGMLQGQQYQMNQLKLAEDQRRLMQEEAMRQAMGEIGNIPTQMPQFQPMPVQEAGGPVEMQPVQQLPAVQRTPEQIRSDAVNVFRQFGVATPQLEALDKALIAAGKLPQVSTEEVPGVGTVVSMGGERKLVEQKTPTFSDVAKQRALTINFPEYQGVAPTEKEASDFREQYSNVLESKRNIGRLLEIANMGTLAQQDPVIKSEAEQLAKAAQGAMRLEIIGPGTVTDRDRALLESIVRNPTDIFSLKSSNVKALTSLLERAGSGLESKAKALGLQSAGGSQAQSPGAKPVMVYDPVTKSFK